MIPKTSSSVRLLKVTESVPAMQSGMPVLNGPSAACAFEFAKLLKMYNH